MEEDHEAVAVEEIAAFLSPVEGKDVLELTLATVVACVSSSPSFQRAKSVTKIALAPGFDDASFAAAVGDRQFDLVVFNRVLTFATESQAKLLARRVLYALRADGEVSFRESCLQEPFPSGQEIVYRHPSFYIGVFGTAVTDDSEARGFAYLDFSHCKSLDVYRQRNHTHGELIFTYKKIEQPPEQEEINSRGRTASQQMDSFQNFLDNQQYSNASITRYEKIFGEGYVSTGGQDTTTEFVAKLDLQPGQRVLDVGCGIGGGDFYMANSFGASVHGIDLSTNMVYRAIEQYATHHTPRDGNDVEFEICDATTKQFPPQSFDVIYSRDTILHIENKETLFAQFFKWLKPGGKLLISDYCCGDDKPPSDHFRAYVKKRGYVLLSPNEYGRVLERVGFVQVKAEDRTDHFVDVLKNELKRTYQNKKQFVEETSEADFNDVVQGWEAKLARCADGDQKWGLFFATKP
jgi:phosphoethanolamine N-methyltransferase